MVTRHLARWLGLSKKKVFYSQQGEDLFVFRNFINQRRSDGVFVELGAYNGVRYSNTKFFEDELDFSGILIEPLPDAYRKLVKNRRRSQCYHCAVSQNAETVAFSVAGATSGIKSRLPEALRNTFHHSGAEILVRTQPLSELLEESNVKYVDFMSIDVEGGEKQVLESMNWAIPVYMICIELDGHDSSKDESCRNILKHNGFEKAFRFNINDFWINPNYERRGLLYQPHADMFGDMAKHGRHPYVERHCIPEINSKLQEYEQRQVSPHARVA